MSTEMRKIVNRSIVWCNLGIIHNSFSKLEIKKIKDNQKKSDILKTTYTNLLDQKITFR